MSVTAMKTDKGPDLIAESREAIATLRHYFSGQENLSLQQFEKLLDRGQTLRDQLEAEIFALRDQKESKL